MTAAPGALRVRPVLFCAPVFFEREYWTESARAWDWVQAETPLDQKPWAELEISLDVTLGEVLDSACSAWGIEAGPDLLKHGGTRRGQFFRFGFVDAYRDAAGSSERWGYLLPPTLPIARESGVVERAPALEIRYRELLASSALGLLDGDATRPYVHPVTPQGDLPSMIEAGHLTVEAIRVAYHGVDSSFGFAEHTIQLISASLPRSRQEVDQLIVEGTPAVGLFSAAYRLLRRRHRSRKIGSEPDEPTADAR